MGQQEQCDTSTNGTAGKEVAAQKSPALSALQSHIEKWYGTKDEFVDNEAPEYCAQEGFVGLNKYP